MEKSILLFIFGCIPTRICLGLLAKYIPKKYLLYWAVIVLLMSLGFFYLYFTGKRKTGPETGGKPIWWMRFRIFHGIMYLLAAFFAFKLDGDIACNLILADTAVGFGLFINHHFL